MANGSPTSADAQTIVQALQNLSLVVSNIVKLLDTTGKLRPTALELRQETGPAPASPAAISMTHGGSGGAARLPEAPDGYWTMNVPGVGPRKIPYYRV